MKYIHLILFFLPFSVLATSGNDEGDPNVPEPRTDHNGDNIKCGPRGCMTDDGGDEKGDPFPFYYYTNDEKDKGADPRP